MSSTVTDYQVGKFKEQESKRLAYQMKKVRESGARDYQKEVKKNENLLNRMKMEYETKITNMQNDTEQKLARMRKKHSKSITMENEKLGEELSNLRVAHKQQKDEIKSAQANELRDIKESHRKTLERAEAKFNKEMLKYETV
jgi:hypothetical protein